MNVPLDEARRALFLKAFWMPSVQTMVSRKSSITNAFVNAVIPTVTPTAEEVEQALTILGLDPVALCCAYCGDPATEWDHLRPLVVKHRPTGYISEIANLVPSCGKCNQSKGNKDWRAWMLSDAPRCPTGRGIADVAHRVERLDAYERWRAPMKVDFEAIIGREAWERYWAMWEVVNGQLKECQQVADGLKGKIVARMSGPGVVGTDQTAEKC
jgi:hypothetical protein